MPPYINYKSGIKTLVYMCLPISVVFIFYVVSQNTLPQISFHHALNYQLPSTRPFSRVLTVGLKAQIKGMMLCYVRLTITVL